MESKKNMESWHYKKKLEILNSIYNSIVALAQIHWNNIYCAPRKLSISDVVRVHVRQRLAIYSYRVLRQLRRQLE